MNIYESHVRLSEFNDSRIVNVRINGGDIRLLGMNCICVGVSLFLLSNKEVVTVIFDHL
jgi:hypothetical protein